MGEFLETVAAEYNNRRAKRFAGDYEGVTHAGLAIVALDSGNVLLAQRAMDETDAPEVQETWEFPGGSLDAGEEPLAAAIREYGEEVCLPLPVGMVVNGWRAGPEDNYQGFVYNVATEFDLSVFVPNDEVQGVAWVEPIQLATMHPDLNIRPEMRDFDTTLLDVSGNEDAMPPEDTRLTEPDLTWADLTVDSIPIHGVLAPEDVQTGDGRGFNAGSVTSRPGILPFSWQKSAIGGHDGSIVTGGLTRLMRREGLIHYEGLLMPTEEAGEFTGLLAFFGRFGVSVDGDNGSIDTKKASATGVMWFDAVRASGLTAVAIPAFHEAYVALGPHPDMPTDATLTASMVAEGDLVTFSTFDRGPGWITNPVETKRIHDYWTKKGEEGYAKIGWGTPGDFTRAKKLIGAKIAANSPEDMRYLNQIIAQWHHDALGYWPGELGKPGNAPDTPENRRRAARHAAASDGLIFRDVPTDERKRLADEDKALPDGSFPIADCSDLSNAIQAIGRAKDPAKAKAHIRKRKSALGCEEVDIPETWNLRAEHVAKAAAHGIIVTGDIEKDGWEVVLTAGAGGAKVRPPLSYFEKQEGSGSLYIAETPDADGFRQTWGYAGEFGVCHIGYDNRCVEIPESDDFSDFHLGYTRTSEGMIRTGVIAYMVDHREAGQILSETPEQSHFDNVANAWAQVRLGYDERGIWFAGVVLPGIDEDDITLIEATGQVSGEWKYGALRALQSVNTPGLGVKSSAEYDENGEVIALVASAHGLSDCEPTPAEVVAAMRNAVASSELDDLRGQFAKWAVSDDTPNLRSGVSGNTGDKTGVS